MEKLFKAIQKGDLQTVEDELRGNPTWDINAKNKKGYAPIHAAVQCGDLAILQALFEHFGEAVDPNLVDGDQGWTPLIHVVTQLQGDGDTIKLLLKHKADIEGRDKSTGWTALHWAAKMNQTGTMRFLLDRRAKIDADSTDDKHTPLHVAILHGMEEAAQALVEGGANLNAKDADGNTPIHLAVRQRMSNICALMVEDEKRIDISETAIKNGDGDTPLHLAADQGLIGLESLLKKKGFPADAKNKKGETAADKTAGRIEKEKILQKEREEAKANKDLRKRREAEEDMESTEVTAFLKKNALDNLVEAFYKKHYRYLDESFFEIAETDLKKMGVNKREEREKVLSVIRKEIEEREARERSILDSMQAAGAAKQKQVMMIAAGVVVFVFFLIYLFLNNAAQNAARRNEI